MCSSGLFATRGTGFIRTAVSSSTLCLKFLIFRMKKHPKNSLERANYIEFTRCPSVCQSPFSFFSFHIKRRNMNLAFIFLHFKRIYPLPIRFIPFRCSSIFRGVSPSTDTPPDRWPPTAAIQWARQSPLGSGWFYPMRKPDRQAAGARKRARRCYAKTKCPTDHTRKRSRWS